jgi:hypothetical protein
MHFKISIIVVADFLFVLYVGCCNSDSEEAQSTLEKTSVTNGWTLLWEVLKTSKMAGENVACVIRFVYTNNLLWPTIHCIMKSRLRCRLFDVFGMGFIVKRQKINVWLKNSMEWLINCCTDSHRLISSQVGWCHILFLTHGSHLTLIYITFSLFI